MSNLRLLGRGVVSPNARGHTGKMVGPLVESTILICFGLLATALTLPVGNPVQTFNYAAVAVAPVLALAFLIEGWAGVRNLFRTDILMFVVLYGLTFLEFLFPQDDLSGRVSAEGAVQGTEAVLLGFVGIAIGRHFVGKARLSQQSHAEFPPRGIIGLILVAFSIGYLHIFLAVNFDVFEALRQMALPRFSQSWGRGRLGDLSALLVELGLWIYLIPPIAGSVYAQHRRYTLLQKAIVTVILLFTFYYGFSGGTRNVFGVFVITFIVAYCMFKPELTFRHLLAVAIPTVVVLGLATYYMLEFRRVGLGNYEFGDEGRQTIFIDQNIVNISNLTEVFPSRYDYLGLEIPFNVLIRPIPRALWSEKPEGLSVGIEEALGVQGLGLTLSATFVGESYMAGGLIAVLFAGLLLGAAAAFWNKVGQDLSSNFKLIFYSSGFFPAAIAMRSMLVIGSAVLPAIALWLYGRFKLGRSPVSITGGKQAA